MSKIGLKVNVNLQKLEILVFLSRSYNALSFEILLDIMSIDINFIVLLYNIYCEYNKKLLY